MEGDSSLYRPCIKHSPFGGERQSFEHATTVRLEGLDNASDHCDSQLVGVPVVVSCGAAVEELKASPAGTNVTGSSEKRKRGRQPKGQTVPKRNPPPLINKMEEEDVCFICFDGGSLVLCDRKGCPKAYHPACIKRDEAFFQSTAKWNCGWHICSVCQKAAHYMCYTCTYSFCKGCTKDADFLCVRRNMGFCTTCMKTIMLIENKDQANKELVRVDFDDKSSWEYLCKVYWILLKEKLSLTLDELTKAKNPWKGVVPVTKQQLPDSQHALDHSNRFLPHDNSKLTEPKKEDFSAKEPGKEGTAYKASGESGAYLAEDMEWASKVFGSHENNGSSASENKNKRRKTRIKVEEGAVAQQNNLDEYAAIDIHNINLIYLRRDWMESLTEDEKFHNMVIGSIVRIRISSCDQKQDLFRLVQVVGISKVAVPYKIGERTVDIMLEVLNLHKKEVITIDAISNQEFSEEECLRLRQSIRCGLVKRLTVGEIQKKAMELQASRLNDLEAEILKLNHLRDRASEKGHKKELRECIEKLQILKTPEECQRRLCQIPEVHADPTVDPDYESEEETGGVNDKRQDMYIGQKHYGFNRGGKKPTTLKRKVKEEGPIDHQYRINWKRDANGLNDQDVVKSVAKIPTTATLATESSSSPSDSETDKFWHYRDPTGKIQGPFSMMQLRRWSTTGYFPPDMKIWTINEDDDLILLTDALNGNFHTAAHLLYNFSLQCQQLGAASDNRVYSSDVPRSENLTGSCDGNQILEAVQPSDAGVQSNNNNKSPRTDGLGSISSGSSMSVVSEKEIQPGTPSHQELKDNSSSSDHSQVCHPPLTSSVGEGQGNGSEGSRLGPFHDNKVLHEDAAYQIPDGQFENQSNCKGYLHQSSGQNWRSFPINLNSDMDTSDGFSPVTKCSSSEQDGEVYLPEFLHAPKDSKRGSEGQAAEKLQSVSSDVPAHVPHVHNLLSLTPKAAKENRGQLAENKQPPSAKDAVQDSGHSGSSASSLVVGGAQLPEIADEWARYSPSPAKPSVEEWSSGIVSVSSLKQPEIVGDHATPTSNIDPLACTSPSHPTSNASGWHPIIEPIEFSILAEESVSDLLAEVDAMEYQSGLASPTSAMRCEGEMICRNDSFNIDDLNLSPDPGKSDALSSTGDIQLACRSTVTDEPVGASPADAFDPLKRSSGYSSTSSEAEKRSADIPPNQGEAGSAAHATHIMSHLITDTTIPQSTGVGAIDTVWGRLPGHVNLNWGAPAHGILNIGWDTSQGAHWGNLNVNHGAFNGGTIWDGQPRYSHTGPVNQFQGADMGYSRERPFWNTPSPKGQRVCKFFESGHCKKGASCDYLHL